MYAWNWSPRAVSIGLMAPLDTQSLTWTGSVGPGAMSGRSVPAAMPLAIWLVESRFVVRCTWMPLLCSNGFRTSWNAFSSPLPQAVQTVTSVDEAPPPVVPPPPPPPQAASRNNAPRPSATTRELRLAKTSAITALLPCVPLPGRPIHPSPGATSDGPVNDTPRRTFALANARILNCARQLVNLRLGRAATARARRESGRH